MINYDIFLPQNLAQMDVFWVIAAPSAPGGTACIVSQVVTLRVHIQHKSVLISRLKYRNICIIIISRYIFRLSPGDKSAVGAKPSAAI